MQKNPAIKIIFQLIDFKVGPTSLDLEIYQKLNEASLQPILILNKKDKVLLNKINHRLKQIEQIFNNLEYSRKPQIYLLSCKKRKEWILLLILFMKEYKNYFN